VKEHVLAKKGSKKRKKGIYMYIHGTRWPWGSAVKGVKDAVKGVEGAVKGVKVGTDKHIYICTHINTRYHSGIGMAAVKQWHWYGSG
jgi:hypothetical protein